MNILLGLEDAAYHFAAQLFHNAYSKMQAVGTDVSDILTSGGDTQMADITEKLQTQVETVAIPAVEAFALAVALLFFIISLVEIVSQDRLTMEFFIKFFAKFLIAVFFISNAGKLFAGICDIGDGMAGIFSDMSLGKGEFEFMNVDELAEKFKESDIHWMEAICTAALTAGPIYLVSLILVSICYIIAFSRILELAARGSFLPIALAMMSDDGWRGAGGRYIRKLLAIASQSAVLVLIAQFTTYIIGSVGTSLCEKFEGTVTMGDITGTLVIILGVCISCVSLMFKSIGIVNDAFGG